MKRAPSDRPSWNNWGSPSWSTSASQTRQARQLCRMHHGVRLSKKMWICEPALWIKGWQNRGNFLGVSDSSLLVLESQRFSKITGRFPNVHSDLAMYASYVLQKLQDVVQPVTDLWRPDVLDVT